MTASKTKLIVWLAGMVLIHVWLFWKVRTQLEEGYPDFTIFYTAGKIVRSGAGTHLYDGGLQFEIQRQFAPRVYIRQGALPYNHPPFEALVFVPFAFLSYSFGYLVWGSINILILAITVALTRTWLPRLRKQYPWYLWMLGCLGFFPIFIALVQGQDVLLLLLFYTLAFAALRKNREFAGGCWLALGLVKPQLVLPTIVVFLLQKRKRTGLGFLCVAVILAALSIAVVGWKAFVKYPAYIWLLELSLGRGAITPSVMPNIRGLVADFLREPRGTVVVTIVAALSLLLLIFAESHWRLAPQRSSRDLGFSVILIATILVSYHAYAYDLSLLILPVLWISEYAVRNADSLRRSDRILLLGPVFVLFLTPFYLLLLLRIDHFSVMAIVLGLWFFSISREIRRADRVSSAQGT